MTNVWIEKTRCISTKLCAIALIFLGIRLGEIVFIYVQILTMLTDVVPVMKGYMIMRVITNDQYFTGNSDLPVLHCLEM